ncbi:MULTISPECIES: DUF1987 domain-containing protein [Raineya]|jgi:hypothetical protein|uniref:SiaC family regulatory phosphoprotein domain-containing protein n=1 Tax=Raineya orbicola TaxID=2016530 RepID=A0A2N3IK73_9BACT|nr:DUF1987 domain-containing protein [Raineya orbicola]PKQ70717.1 hypothetical protein Rain11_0254 [Raineya orbicola]
MEIINLEGTEETPKVILDKDNGIFEISGRSLPEDVRTFYQQVLDWLDKYAAAPNPETKFTFKLEYFNTASSKVILDVLTKLEGISGAKVIWYHHDDDEDMEEAGKEFQDIVDGLPFEFKTY